MKNPFSRRKSSEDFSNYLGKEPQSKKRRLLEQCEKYDVSIYLDNPSEQTEGVYAQLRAVASEVELERRLHAVKAVGLSKRANLIAVFALLVALAAFIKSFF